MSDTTEIYPARTPGSTSRRRSVVLVAALMATVLIASGMVAWQWWTHPKAFTALGDSFTSTPLPLAEAPLSTTVIFPKVSGSDEEMTIEGLNASFSRNSAEAEATFWICHMADGEDPVGAVHDLGSVCGDVEPFKSPMRFTHGVVPDTDYLGVTLTPTRKGVAHLREVDVEYRRSGEHLYQRGIQTIRVDRKFIVR